MLMRLNFAPTGQRAGSVFTPEGEAPVGVIGGARLFWSVKHVSSASRIRVATGDDLHKVDGNAFITIGDAPGGSLEFLPAEAHAYGTHAAFFFVQLSLSQQKFDHLRSLVERGMAPSLTVWLKDDIAKPNPIRPGPDSDRVLEWDSAQHPTVGIQWAEFLIDSGNPHLGEDAAGQTWLPPTRADLIALADALDAVARQFSRVGRYLLIGVWVAVALLALLVLRR